MMLSDVCLSDVWCLSRTSGISREQRGLHNWHRGSPRHTLLWHHFQGQKFKGQRSRSPGRFTHRRVNASGSCSGERGNVLAVGKYCYVVVCSAAWGASAPTEGGERRGILWRPSAYSL